ncbi:growth/differentiation factor 10 [Osmerus eperlanus]|uniref:growth/differentiation factor 10 n=1 Tax=Osmerus eperlanus TaxID=29151 RepID=UPI002E0D764B
MGTLSMFSLYTLVLGLNGYLGAAAGRNLIRAMRSARESPFESFLDGARPDAVSQHMFKVYEKYNRDVRRPQEGNTVRSFKGIQELSDQRGVYHLNLTSLLDSEVIQSASFHFLFDRRPRQRAWFCKRFKAPSCRALPLNSVPSVHILLRSLTTGSEVTLGSQGSLLGNVTFHPHRRGVWQMKDVTQVIKEARWQGQLLVSLEMDYGLQYQRYPDEALSEANLPYLLVYADDQALVEPNSVAATLQRYDPFSEGGEASPAISSPSLPHPASLSGRVRRQAPMTSDPIHNNELPEVDYTFEGYSKESLWHNTYLALKPKAKPEKKEKRRKVHEGGEVGQDEGKEGGVERRGEHQVQREEEGKLAVLRIDQRTVKKPNDGRKAERRDERKDGGSRDGGKHEGRDGGARGQSRSPELRFDERTMRQARRRQWGLPQQKGCTRRSLRVDFSDIGWSEWVLAPKAFDAYYCAGTCGFPMPKLMRPSNHATIQSIVRAVGIVPGVPEPCCVPEKMSSLAVLYQEEDGNPVLKVYPAMSVETCSCR